MIRHVSERWRKRRSHRASSIISDVKQRKQFKALVVASVVALPVATTVGASSGQTSVVAPCTSVALSTGAGGNGMTGGTIAWRVTLTNTGHTACEVEGHPWVRVPPAGYAVQVDDLRTGEYGGGPGRMLQVAPRQTVQAHVLMMRSGCDFTKSDSATLAVRIGWATRSVITTGEACLREGATVAVGPFER
jgi:hypothetical protein